MSTATQFVVLTPALIGFAGLAIDTGWYNQARVHLQDVADVAALAAVLDLPDAGDARATATALAGLNTVGGTPVTLSGSDIDVGVFSNGTFVVTGIAPNAVRVRARRPALGLFFGGLFGVPAADVEVTSIALSMRGSAFIPCVLFFRTGHNLSGHARVYGYDSTVSLDPSLAPDTPGICTNADRIRTEGDYAVYGDAHPGPDGTVTTDGASSISGDRSPLPEPIVLPTYPMPIGGFTDLGSLSVSGRTAVNLACGTTYVAHGISVSGMASLNVPRTCTRANPVRIYTDAGVSLNGQGMVNASGDPGALVWHHVGTSGWQTNGTSVFYGVVDAPNAEIHLNGTADIYGAFAANYVHHQGNAKLFLDTSQAEPMGTAAHPSGHARLVQ